MTRPTTSGSPTPGAATAAWGALAVGLAYAAISAYWGAGGTGLLDTVGGTFERWGRRGGTGVVLLLWTVVLVKAVAATLPLVAMYHVGPRSISPAIRGLAWADGVVLSVYGLVLTAAGLSIQAGLISATAPADRRALAWHAYLWDPWFLLWGGLVVVALTLARQGSRRHRAHAGAI